MVILKRRYMAVLIASLLLAAVMSLSGCRPDDTIPDGVDTTTVVIEEFPDTLVGVWEADTMDSGTDMLFVHQGMLGDVFFDYDSDELSDEALSLLMENASYIMETTGYRVLIEGHCDERGTIDYNLALGESRALAVYNYLVNYGVGSSRLEYVSYGKERPFDPAHTEVAWISNRRAHFRVIPGN